MDWTFAWENRIRGIIKLWCAWNADGAPDLHPLVLQFLWEENRLKNISRRRLNYLEAELANSVENTIAIAFLSTIAIAIDKEIFELLLVLLIRASSN